METNAYIERKREKEKQTIGFMIALYCRGMHHTKKGCLCGDCRKLTEYADIWRKHEVTALSERRKK